MTSKMRILHVVPAYLPATRYGGPSFAVHGLCRSLAARGHHIEVFTTNVDGAANSAVPLRVPVLLDGVHVRYFPSRTLRRLFWSPPLARALRADRAGFDLIHLHSVFLWPTWAAARSARKAHIPYLISPRGMLVKDLIKRHSRLVKSAWIKFIESENLESASGIHVTSALEREELQRFGWRLPPITTIPNGVDDVEGFAPDDVARDVKELTNERPFILFLGRISWKKGLDRLLNAFARTHLGNLVIVGPDDEILAPGLAQRARALQIADRVRFLTRTVVGADKEYLYQSATVFVLPSYSENFGNVVLEAMQRGLPVVVTPEVGAAEIVRKSDAGLVVAGNPELLGAAICRLTTDAHLARSMGQAGQRHAAHYSWDRIAARMEEMYESLRCRRV
jgi:glycosyltransferase involved in cell wall biosynthesis